MVKNYLKLFLAATTLFVASTSCEESTNESTDENTQQEETTDFMSETPFTLSAEQITPISFLLDVKAGDYEDQYYMYIDSKSNFEESFGGDIDLAIEDKLFQLVNDQYTPTDFSVVDYNWIFKGDNKITAATIWSVYLTPSNEVVAFVFGVDDYGELTTKPASLNVTMLDATEVVDASLDIEEVAINPTSLEVSISPEDGIDQYCVFAVISGDVQDGGYYTNKAQTNGTDRYYEAASDFLTNARYYHTIDFATVDNDDIFSGDQNVVVTSSMGNNPITPNQEYTIIAIGVDAYGYIASNAGHLDVVSANEELSDLSFEVVFNDEAYTDDGFAFKVYPSDQSAYYYVNVATQSTIDALGGAESPDAIVEYFDTFGIQYSLTYGNSADYMYYAGLSVNTDYYVVLFGYNGGITSEITLVSCKTGILQD